MFKNSVFYKDLLISLNSLVGKSIIVFFAISFFIGFLLTFSSVTHMDYYDLSRLGKEIFIIAGIGQILALLFLGYVRGLACISQEYNKGTLELLMITGISPVKFILGKVLSIFVNIELLFLISLPFLSIGLLLGGVNVSDILLYSLYFSVYSFTAILFGMLFSIALKTQLKSILGGIIAPFWIGMLVLSLYLTVFEFLGLREPLSGTIEPTIAAIFPLFMFETIDNTTINFFGINVHYIVLHVILFTTLILFLFRFILNKIKVFYTTKDTSNDPILAACLVVLFTILGHYTTQSGEFVFLALGSIYISLLYLYNQKDNTPLKRQSFIYIALVFVIFSTLTILFNGLFLYVLLFIYSLLIFIIGSYFLIEKIILKAGRGVINISHFLFLFIAIFVYPLISTNLMKVELPHFGEQFKIAYYLDNTDYINSSISEDYSNNYVEGNYLRSYEWRYYLPGFSYLSIIVFYLTFGAIFFSFYLLLIRRENK